MKKILVLLLFSLFSCTDNQMTRHFGGKETVYLKPTEKFVNITWREQDLWVVVQDTVTGVHYAREKSSYGLLQGEITIQHSLKDTFWVTPVK